MTTDQATGRGSLSELIEARLAGSAGVDDPDLPGDLVAETDEVIAEALAVHAHWDTTSVLAARAIVRAQMRRRHVELTDGALDALAAHSTRDFRC